MLKKLKYSIEKIPGILNNGEVGYVSIERLPDNKEIFDKINELIDEIHKLQQNQKVGF